MTKLTPLAQRWIDDPKATSIWTVDVHGVNVFGPIERSITSCRAETLYVNHAATHSGKAKFLVVEKDGIAHAVHDATHRPHRAGQGYSHFKVYPCRTMQDALALSELLRYEIEEEAKQAKLWNAVTKEVTGLHEMTYYLGQQLSARMSLEEALAEVIKLKAQITELLDRPSLHTPPDDET
jgi:hypothetical protein